MLARLLLFFALSMRLAEGQLPGTAALTPRTDFSEQMVAGIDRLALRLLAASRAARKPSRDKLKAALGLVDPRVSFDAFELVGDLNQPALLQESSEHRIYRVRWPVLDGLTGEGLYLQPKAKPLARVIHVPDADTAPEKALASLRMYAGCEIVIPCLINRSHAFSRNDSLGLATQLSHREWIHRQSFVLGRHLIGYEVQKVLALIDHFAKHDPGTPIHLAGQGEGGLMVLCAAALEDRVHSVSSSGYFGPREGLWQEPLERNLFGWLRDLGDAELVALIAPRPVLLEHAHYPELVIPTTPPPGLKARSAPGRLTRPDEAPFLAETERVRQLQPKSRLLIAEAQTSRRTRLQHLFPAATAEAILATQDRQTWPNELVIEAAQQKRQVDEMQNYTQRLLAQSESERDAAFWKKLPLASLPAYEKHNLTERARLGQDVIGRLPDPDQPMNAKSRLVRETERVRIYEVTLEVWQDVFAWGWLCLPKEASPGTRRPVVVCQHGLEGLPEDTFTTDPTQRAYTAYQAFALRLAEQGFVTFAPHHPYRGQDAFRTLQRKLNPLGLTLFSVIIGQHQRLLEWLKAQPFTQADKIAFYGLSYGGKSAMRIPAILPDYALSICSGDFNEWVRKCASTDLPMSYLYTGEYEIWEWNLGRTFNYAEMAALIAPRPFMVERGHDDGVGTDAWVNYEYAKVRRLYAKLGIPERTEIEHFNAGHQIHSLGTFAFLKRHLGWKSEP